VQVLAVALKYSSELEYMRQMNCSARQVVVRIVRRPEVDFLP